MREFDLEVPGAVLRRPARCRITVPDVDGVVPWAMLVHGYTASPQWGFWPELARRLAAVRIGSARVAFSGDGLARDMRTFEDLDAIARDSYVDELADLAALRRALEEAPRLDPARAALVGHSRGGGIGLVHAAEDGRYRAVVTWAAFDRILRFSPERLDEWRRQGWLDVVHHGLGRRVRLDVSVLDAAEQARDRLDVLAACGRLSCPVLAVHGARDRRLPVAVAENIARAARHGSLVVIDDAGHAFGARDPLTEVPERLDRLLTITVDWLRARLVGS